MLIVSDGSYHPEIKVGTAAWIITTESTLSTPIFGDNIIPGDSIIQYLYHSELGGLISTLFHWNRIYIKHEIGKVEVEVRCDGLE